MYSPRLYDGDLIDYYALPIALNNKELLRYSRDLRLPLKSMGYLNLLSRSLLLGVLLTSAVIRVGYLYLLLSDSFYTFAIPSPEPGRWLIFRQYYINIVICVVDYCHKSLFRGCAECA